MHSNEWSAIVATTAQKYVKGRVDACLRSRVVFNKLLKDRQIKKSIDGGTELRWQIRIDTPDVLVYTGQALDFEPSDTIRQAVVDWRSFITTDALHERDDLVNSGTQALVKRYDEIVPGMQQTMEDHLHADLYNDGAVNTTRWHGLPTMFTATTPGAADLIAVPNGTYAGRSTVLGAHGGTWSASGTALNATLAKDWPDGTGDYSYDCWSPKMWNLSSTGWGTGSTSWIDNCTRVLRRAKQAATITGGESGAPNMCMLCSSHYYDFANRQEAKMQISVPAGGNLEVSFDGFNFEGLQLFTEYGIPANTTYMLNTRRMRIEYLGDQLFRTSGPVWQEDRLSWIYSNRTYGNFRFETPKAFTKIYPYA
jgi:hypothetical protein